MANSNRQHDQDETPLPASETKHLSLLHHPIPCVSYDPSPPVYVPLRQVSSTESRESTGTTGTTLWLSAQLLSLYLASTLPRPSSTHSGAAAAAAAAAGPGGGGGGGTSGGPDGQKKTVLDLGSGVGYLPLCLASWGYGVMSTDIQGVIDSVLGPNIDSGMDKLRLRQSPSRLGHAAVVPLDWEEVAPPQSVSGAGTNANASGSGLPDGLGDIEMITTSDTFYAPHLVVPLLTTMRAVSLLRRNRRPTIYIALERRDSALVDYALGTAGKMGLSLNRVDKGKIDRLMREAGWAKEGWDDVEIWKGKFSKASLRDTLA